MTANPNQSADQSKATLFSASTKQYFSRLIVGLAIAAAAVFLFYAVLFFSLMAGGGF